MNTTNHLVNRVAERSLVRDAAFDTFWHELAGFLYATLEVTVSGASFHGAQGTHTAIALEATTVGENHFARSFFGTGEHGADHHGVVGAQVLRRDEHLQAGLPTVTDILQALAKPGRDPREDSPAPLSRKNVTKLSELQIGSIVKGTIRNVVDFGCFVDIGLKVNGLIHRSELSNRRFKHPLDIVSTGDIVDVMIISIDEARGRIGLSLKRVPEAKNR